MNKGKRYIQLDHPRLTRLGSWFLALGSWLQKSWFPVLGSWFLILGSLGCTRPFDIQENTPAGNVAALWQIIDEKYCFVEEKGIDWDAVRAPYIARAEAIDPDAEDAHFLLFDLMAEMLDTLRDGHVNLYTPFDVSASSTWYQGYPVCYDADLHRQYLANARYVGGMYYTTLADESIGYIYYGSFQSSFSAANLYYILSSFKDCRGLILDLRHNGGGSLDYAYRLAATFIDHDTLVGYWQHKRGTGHNDYSDPEPLYVRTADMGNKWLRPTVVLQDRHSYSATNSFINAMRYMPNVLLLGGVSGGGGGMPMSYELPNGWIVRFSSVRMCDADGISIEEGIPPHILDSLHPTPNPTQDNLIEHAIQFINQAYDHSTH